MRGEIQNRKRAQQIIDYSGLQFPGNITPTDIDGFIDFGGQLFVTIEAKHTDASLPYGQRLALERWCDGTQGNGIEAVVLVIEHDTKPDEDIYAATCSVRELRFAGRWRSPKRRLTCRQAIDLLREWADIL